jgi:hypothetical protein
MPMGYEYPPARELAVRLDLKDIQRNMRTRPEMAQSTSGHDERKSKHQSHIKGDSP